MQRPFTALVLASVLWAGFGPLAGSARAADIIVDDGDNHFRPVASNVPAFGNVWNSMAQSFTAEDPSILFGFRLKDFDSSLPHAGASIIYNLYAGENSYATLLASKTVTLPNALSTDRRSVFGDVGFVDADFSNVTLVLGQKYTVEITVPSSALPATGSDTGFGVWTSLNNPYSGGRFFFPTGYDNNFFSQQDMSFRVTTVLSPAQMISNLINAVTSANFHQGNALLENALSSLNSGNTGAACNQIGAFINQVRAQSGKELSVAVADELIASANRVKATIGCP